MRARVTLTLTVLGSALGLTLATAEVVTAQSNDPTKPPSTPGIACDAGSKPETGIQGEISQQDLDSGRWQEGFTCNTRLVSRIGTAQDGGGGYRVERYVDARGQECAFFDTGTLFPNTVHPEGSGVWVVDMSDRRNPRLATTLTSAAMVSPHESLRLNQRRGLLVAVMGLPAFAPGVVDVYSVKENCLEPELLSTTPLGLLGHESAFSPDGRTFYVNSDQSFMAVVGLDDPTDPQLLYTTSDWNPHGASVSNDGNTLFVAGENAEGPGLVILDVSEIQARKPDPQVREISFLSWPEVSIPQTATPFRSRGHDYVMQVDEFGDGGSSIGAARIINVDDLTAPYVVSHLRLAIHNEEASGSDRSAHYCSLPSRVNPAVIACSMLHSGLRIFDIRDVENPREVAYANFTQVGTFRVGNAYSAPAYDPASRDIWYADANRGLLVAHLTKKSGIRTFATRTLLPGN